MTALTVCASMAAASAVTAQDYPTRPLHMIVPFTAGSGSDMLARIIAPRMFETSGFRVVVDNRAGAGSTIGTALAAGAAPDGHTLMLTSSGFAGSASIYAKLPYDPVRDFAGITQVISNPLVLVVAPSLNIKTTGELIALAKQKPLTYASTGVGSATHYAAELFRLAAKFDATHVPYKGVPEALTDTIAGRVNFYLATVLAVVPQVRECRLVALAVTTRSRSALMPDVPTIAAAGLADFEYEGWYGMLAPARTPRSIVQRVSQEMARILALPDINEKIVALGGEAKWTAPAAFDQLIRTEIATRAKVFNAIAKID